MDAKEPCPDAMELAKEWADRLMFSSRPTYLDLHDLISADRVRNQEEVTRLREACGIFLGFLQFAEAAAAMEEFDQELTDRSVVAHLDFGGGSILLDISHFRKLRTALASDTPVREEWTPEPPQEAGSYWTIKPSEDDAPEIVRVHRVGAWQKIDDRLWWPAKIAEPPVPSTALQAEGGVSNG